MSRKDVVMKLKIPVLWHTDETMQKEELGIEVSSDEVTTRLVTFYTIDSVTDYYEDNKVYTKFYSCGQVYLTTIDRNTLETKIDEQLILNK
jgi:hypothetical protein